MNEWLNKLADSVDTAAIGAGLEKLEAGAFDGDSWVWAWRWAKENDNWKPLAEVLLRVKPKALAPVAETVLRVRPDSLNEGIEIEISSRAWLLECRGVSAGRTYYTGYFDFNNFPPKTFVSDLKTYLSMAREGALALAQRLPDLKDSRLKALMELKEKGLMHW